MTVTIDPEFKKLIPPLRPEEYAQLEANIKREGCRDPLVLWKRGECDYVLIDGHNRYEICETHGVQHAVKEMEFADRASVRIWIRSNQMGRRNLNDAQRIELQLGNKDDMMERGREVMSSKGKEGGRGHVKGMSELDRPFDPPHSTRDQIADAVNVGTGTIARAEVIRNADPEKWQECQDGAKSINKAYEEVKKIVHVSQNTGEMEWYTPQNIIEMARVAMGSIDLDPASCAIANDAVKADAFYDQESDGLLQNWRGNVWLNPPFCQPLIQQFLKKTVDSYRDKAINQACVYTNNATDTQWWQDAAANADAICFVRGRLRCYRPDGTTGQSPLQGQTIMYFGDNTMCFTEIFDQIGAVLIHG